MDYDIIFVTNVPAFYKIRLYQALAERCRVLAIFLSKRSDIRSADFYGPPGTLSTVFLDEAVLEERSVAKTSYHLWHFLRGVRAQLLVVGGWDAPEYWVALMTAQVQHCAIALESSAMESATTGLKGWLKRWFVSRLQIAFPSGKPHADLLYALGFKGKLWLTRGVGIFSYQEIDKYPHLFQGRFLYVGRLAPEKNLVFLIRVFEQYPHLSLTIVGSGPLETDLKKQAPPNVRFLGHVPNQALADVYSSHDVFVLPSLQEPWGLVVEEALHYGLPILAAHTVGCAEEWVVTPKTGVLFDPKDEASLRKAINTVCNEKAFVEFQKNALSVNFQDRDAQQAQGYWSAIGI